MKNCILKQPFYIICKYKILLIFQVLLHISIITLIMVSKLLKLHVKGDEFNSWIVNVPWLCKNIPDPSAFDFFPLIAFIRGSKLLTINWLGVIEYCMSMLIKVQQKVLWPSSSCLWVVVTSLYLNLSYTVLGLIVPCSFYSKFCFNTWRK